MHEEPIGTGKVAEVFARGPHVLKRYRSASAKADALREGAILAALEPLGLPAPRVHAVSAENGHWGVVMDRAPGRPFLETMLADAAAVPAHIAAMVRLHRRIHDAAVAGLPGHKAKLAAAIGRAPGLDAGLRARLMAQLAALPAGERLCHLDFHPGNIIGTPEAAMVVDWPDAALGDPAADVCRTWVLLHPHAPALADGYLAAYAASSGVTPEAILAWRAVIAGARLAEGVPEQDALMAWAAG